MSSSIFTHTNPSPWTLLMHRSDTSHLLPEQMRCRALMIHTDSGMLSHYSPHFFNSFDPKPDWASLIDEGDNDSTMDFLQSQCVRPCGPFSFLVPWTTKLSCFILEVLPHTLKVYHITLNIEAATKQMVQMEQLYIPIWMAWSLFGGLFFLTHLVLSCSIKSFSFSL